MKILSIDPGQKNFAWILIDLPGFHVESYGQMDVQVGSASALLRNLDQEFRQALDDCEQVIIERQTFKNFTMSKLSFYIEMYCASSKGIPTCMVEARDKLGIFKDHNLIVSKDIKNHYQRKQISIHLVKKILEKELLTGLDTDLICEKKKKVDDICDCVLQSIAYYTRVFPGGLQSFFSAL
jgi:hypothetical protein